MNSTVLHNMARFVLLLAVQQVICSRLNLGGFLNPYPYILFIILYPVNSNRNGLLLASFALGVFMDLFSNSGGVHATACLILAYIRPWLFKAAFGLSYEYQTVRLNDVLSPERFSFILLAVMIHHLVFFILELFSFYLLWELFYKTILTAAFTIIINICIIYLIKPNKR